MSGWTKIKVIAAIVPTIGTIIGYILDDKVAKHEKAEKEESKKK